MLVGGLLLAGLLALLMLHTLAAQDAFRQTALQQRLAALTDTEQSLEQKVQLDSSPTVLRERAKALGMVPSVVTSYHRLADGRVVAREVAASAVAAPTTTTSTAKSTATSTNSKAAATTPTTSTASTQTVSRKTVSTQTAPTSTTASKHRKHHGAARR
jgi:cell division septation protein DedD